VQEVRGQVESVNGVTVEMTASVRAVLVSLGAVRQVVEENRTIVEAMTGETNAAAEAIQTVAAVSEETAAGAEQMSAGSQQVSASSLNVSSAASMQTDSICDLRAAAQSLHGMAVHLTKLTYALDRRTPAGEREPAPLSLAA
jgi:methyl-accepting chemotaxis protein